MNRIDIVIDLNMNLRSARMECYLFIRNVLLRDTRADGAGEKGEDEIVNLRIHF